MEQYIITFTTVENNTNQQICESKEVFDEIYNQYDLREDKLSLSFETIQTTGSI
jgi:hypothetical protein